ncbi:hypothetical protein Daus18300_005866 [Diaporthe australafricana]|uniref:LIM zinc-binding domain-containing protein n=1 Tax=Diaporthe australafricana TaxID=127596 RepID=A0ABR3WZ16_9PEZI
MFDRGRPKDSRPSSPDKRTASSQGSHMNNEQFGTPPPLSEPSPALSQSYSPPKIDHRDFSRPSLAPSLSSRYSTTSGHGRDYYPDKSIAPLKPGQVVPSATYIERGQRWMEKEEAVSLRHAMDDKDARDSPPPTSPTSEDGQLYEAALDEASELVWQHQHGVKPPEPGTPYRYKPHMRRNSYAHARTASAGMYGDEIEPSGLARDHSSRSMSGSSTSSDGFGSSRSRLSYASMSGPRKSPSPPAQSRSASPPKSSKPYTGLSSTSRGSLSQRRRSSTKRNNSGGKPFSGDQIWEEPEGASSMRASSPTKDGPAATEPLRTKPKGPLNRVSFAPERPSSSDSQAQPAPKLHKFEIYRNPPTQSRDPQYTSNSPAQSPVREDVPKKHGIELRGDDIRQATSMRLKDRSPKLPTPTAVSDRLGRPIVSFDKNWKAPDEATDEKPDTTKGRPLGAFQARQDHRRLPETPPIPSIAVTETREPPASPKPRGRPLPSIQVDGSGAKPNPSIPSIAVNDAKPSIPSIAVSDGSPAVPSIVLPGDDNGDDNSPSVPIIVTPEDSTSKPTSRPLPTPQKNAPRIRPGGRPQSHWSPSPTNQAGHRATARCHECNYPIEGRFVALAGTNERFHPQCFSCYSCGTSLEALEISPEPDVNRAARLERIHRRAAGEALEENPGETMAEDGDERLRFYCHLDWHELFAPRCKHCKTPILGEHIVALGEHWHYGHFFCAECGDPFEQGMTHIEKDGYAWCVNCQTKRTERRAPKCRKCNKAVIGQYIRALGGEWHDECFRCAECQSGFDDGQIFPKDIGNDLMVVLCTRCRQRELKG